jgi:hypothetical protein
MSFYHNFGFESNKSIIILDLNPKRLRLYDFSERLFTPRTSRNKDFRALE